MVKTLLSAVSTHPRADPSALQKLFSPSKGKVVYPETPKKLDKTPDSLNAKASTKKGNKTKVKAVKEITSTSKRAGDDVPPPPPPPSRDDPPPPPPGDDQTRVAASSKKRKRNSSIEVPVDEQEEVPGEEQGNKALGEEQGDDPGEEQREVQEKEQGEDSEEEQREVPIEVPVDEQEEVPGEEQGDEALGEEQGEDPGEEQREVPIEVSVDVPIVSSPEVAAEMTLITKVTDSFLSLLMDDIPKLVSEVGGRSNLYNEIYTSKDNLTLMRFISDTNVVLQYLKRQGDQEINTQSKLLSVRKTQSQMFDRMSSCLRRILLEFIPIRLAVIKTNLIANISEITVNRKVVITEYCNDRINLIRFFKYTFSGIPTTASECRRSYEITKSSTIKDAVDLDLFYQLSSLCQTGDNGWEEDIKKDMFLNKIFQPPVLVIIVRFVTKKVTFFSPMSYIGLIIMTHIVKLCKFPEEWMDESKIETKMKIIRETIGEIFNYTDSYLNCGDDVKDKAHVEIDELSYDFNYVMPLIEKLSSNIVLKTNDKFVLSSMSVVMDTRVEDKVTETVSEYAISDSKCTLNVICPIILNQKIITRYSSYGNIYKNILLAATIPSNNANNDSSSQPVNETLSLLNSSSKKNIDSTCKDIFNHCFDSSSAEIYNADLYSFAREEQFLIMEDNFGATQVEDTNTAAKVTIDFNKFLSGLATIINSKDLANFRVYSYFLSFFNLMFDTKDNTQFFNIMGSQYVNIFLNSIVNEVAEKCYQTDKESQASNNIFIQNEDEDENDDEVNNVQVKSNYRRNIQRNLLILLRLITYDKENDFKIVQNSSETIIDTFTRSFTRRCLIHRTTNLINQEKMFANHLSDFFNKGLSPAQRKELVDGYEKLDSNKNTRTYTLPALTPTPDPVPERQMRDRTQGTILPKEGYAYGLRGASATPSASNKKGGKGGKKKGDKKTDKKVTYVKLKSDENEDSDEGAVVINEDELEEDESEDEDEDNYIVESVLEMRGETVETVYLRIQWLGHKLKEDEWEPYYENKTLYTSFKVFDFFREEGKSDLIHEDFRIPFVDKILKHIPSTNTTSITEIQFQVIQKFTAIPSKWLTYKNLLSFIDEENPNILKDYCLKDYNLSQLYAKHKSSIIERKHQSQKKGINTITNQLQERAKTLNLSEKIIEELIQCVVIVDSSDDEGDQNTKINSRNIVVTNENNNFKKMLTPPLPAMESCGILLEDFKTFLLLEDFTTKDHLEPLASLIMERMNLLYNDLDNQLDNNKINENDKGDFLILQDSLKHLTSSITKKAHLSGGSITYSNAMAIAYPSIIEEMDYDQAKVHHKVFFDSICLMINNTLWENDSAAFFLESDFFETYFNNGEENLNGFVSNRNPVFSKLCSCKVIVMPIKTIKLNMIIYFDFSECKKEQKVRVLVIDMSRSLSQVKVSQELHEFTVKAAISGMRRLFMTLSTRRNFDVVAIDLLKVTSEVDDVKERFFDDDSNDPKNLVNTKVKDQYALSIGAAILLGLSLAHSLDKDVWRAKLEDGINTFIDSGELIEEYFGCILLQLCLFGKSLRDVDRETIETWKPKVVLKEISQQEKFVATKSKKQKTK